MSSCLEPLEDLVGETDDESIEWFIRLLKELDAVEDSLPKGLQ